MSSSEPNWATVQATANLWNFRINERWDADLNDPEIAALIGTGMLLLVDENNEAILPPPAPAKSGCGCGS